MHALKQYHKKVRSEMCVPADSQPAEQEKTKDIETDKNEKSKKKES